MDHGSAYRTRNGSARGPRQDARQSAAVAAGPRNASGHWRKLAAADARSARRCNAGALRFCHTGSPAHTSFTISATSRCSATQPYAIASRRFADGNVSKPIFDCLSRRSGLAVCRCDNSHTVTVVCDAAPSSGMDDGGANGWPSAAGPLWLLPADGGRNIVRFGDVGWCLHHSASLLAGNTARRADLAGGTSFGNVGQRFSELQAAPRCKATGRQRFAFGRAANLALF